RSLEKRGVAAMFLTGAAGDINPLTHGDFSLMESVGERLGQAAWQVAERTKAGPAADAWGDVASLSVSWERPTNDQLTCEVADWDVALEKQRAGGTADEKWVHNCLALRRWAVDMLSGLGRA